jgi:DnaK suppressor protein
VKTLTKTKPQAKAAPAKKPAAAKSTVAVKTEPKAKAKAPAAKSPVKVAAKAPPKVVAKLAKPVVAQPVKTEASKVTPKAASKAVSKASASSPPSRTAAPQPLKAAPVPKTDQASPAKSMSVTPVEPVKSPVEQTPASTSPAPEQLVRATRPSARLAQITVPSLPPAVASTAAKSSFMPSATPTVTAMAFAPIKKDPKLANNWKSKKVHELSDAEILAMSDDDYMNETQMAYFRLKLSVLKQEILASAGLTTEHLREDTVVVPDPADRATIEEEHALELRTRDRERKLLKKIEQSIQRIDVGDYGYCDETGEAIGVGRLLARPTATLSLEAQQRRELKQKMFGD